jgi:multidrug efflux system membrane fusion protein
MNTAKLNLNRVRKLYEKGSASLSDYEDAKNSYRTAVASFESAKRSVAIQQDQIQFGYCMHLRMVSLPPLLQK